MILSSPFSRHNRNHQTWTSGSSANHKIHHNHNHDHNNNLSNSLRKPAPTQPAPRQPKAGALNGVSTPVRSQTLNRWDLQQRARSQQPSRQPTTPSSTKPILRNQSSLGYYPISSTGNGWSKPTSRQQQPIYAPASIASPAEFAHYRKPPGGGIQLNGGDDSQHYAATSYRGSRAPSESGRESALGNLFGTLRRHARWSRSSRKQAGSVVSSGASTLIDSPLLPPPPPPPTQLDPEVYASGRREVEAEEIYAEGSRAIDGNGQKRLILHELDESLMSEGETRTIIDEQSKQQVDYQELVTLLTGWINDELSQQRIIVTDLQDDLNDGQVLGKLMERLHKVQLDLVEVTQNETAQRFKLRQVLDTINRILALQARWAQVRWTVEGIHSKNMVEIIHLLVTLALHYRAPIKLPADVRVQVQVVQKYQGQLVRRVHEAQLTDSEAHVAAELASANSKPRDAFDTLLEFAPEKLSLVKQSLVNFVNRHLNKINISCSSRDHQDDILDPDQFSDGLLLVFLIASLEDYFVPFGSLFTSALPTLSRKNTDMNNNNDDDVNSTISSLKRTAIEPTSYVNTQPIHKLHNVNVAFQLMEDAGIQIRDKVRAEDIVNGDLKSVLRILYALFSRYKHL